MAVTLNCTDRYSDVFMFGYSTRFAVTQVKVTTSRWWTNPRRLRIQSNDLIYWRSASSYLQDLYCSAVCSGWLGSFSGCLSDLMLFCMTSKLIFPMYCIFLVFVGPARAFSVLHQRWSHAGGDGARHQEHRRRGGGRTLRHRPQWRQLWSVRSMCCNFDGYYVCSVFCSSWDLHIRYLCICVLLMSPGTA